MLWADARVVQARADAVGLGHLAVVVLQNVGPVSVQHARASPLQRRRVFAAVHAFTGGFDTDQPRGFVGDVGVEDAHGVAAAADAGNHRVGLFAAGHFGHLYQAFLADHALEVAHHHRVGMRAGDRADDVEGVVDIGDPVAHGLVECVFERLAARFDRHHGGAQQFHAVDIGALALDVFAAHVDHTFQAITRADRGGGHAVLSGAGLGDDARLAHAFGQHGLADGVVDLVRTRVVEVFTLEVNLRAAQFTAGARRVVDRRGASDKMRELVLEFGEEFGVVLVPGVRSLQFVDRVGECFGDKAAAVNSEVTCRVRLLVVVHGVLQVSRRQRERLRRSDESCRRF